MADTRKPLHIVATIGLSAGVYAVSLAGVTTLESLHETSLAASRAPAAEAAAAMKASNDQVAKKLAAAGAALNKAATQYQKVATNLVVLEGGMSRLAANVSGIENTPLAMPAVGAKAVTVVKGTTSSGGVASAPLPVVKIVPISVAAPPVAACTTASGKPC